MDPLRYSSPNAFGGDSPPKKSQSMHLAVDVVVKRFQTLVAEKTKLIEQIKKDGKVFKKVEKEMLAVGKEAQECQNKIHSPGSRSRAELKEKLEDFCKVMAKVQAKSQEHAKLKQKLDTEKNRLENIEKDLDMLEALRKDPLKENR